MSEKRHEFDNEFLGEGAIPSSAQGHKMSE